MKQKTKRIIAREGLIILSLILIAVLSLYLASALESKKHEYISNAQEVEIAQQGKPTAPPKTPQTNERPSLDEIYGVSGKQQASLQGDEWVEFFPKGIIVLFPKDTSKSVIEQTIRRDFSYINKVDFILHDKLESWRFVDRYYDSEGNRKFDSFIYKRDFFTIAVFLFLGAYPLYLLIRFVIWSIKTLKNRTGENEQ